MSTFKGMIRLKCTDLANWAAREGLFADVKTTDAIRYSTEGMETVNVFVTKCDSADTLKQELVEAMTEAVNKFSGMDTNFDELMNECLAVLTAKAASQSFSMKLQLPYPYYIEVVIKEVE